jgi:homospermidine synthase
VEAKDYRHPSKRGTNTRVPFNGKILLLGAGAVGRCVLPLLPHLVAIPYSKITVLDMVDNRQYLQEYLAQGLTFVIDRVTEENLESLLRKFVTKGDFLIDLAYEIDTIELLEFCRKYGVLYVNASVEIWNPYANATNKTPAQLTLYWRHLNLRKRMQQWGNNDGPTAILDHGANPGLVSHFVKQGIEDIANKILREKSSENPKRAKRIATLLQMKNFPKLAQELNIRVIHISERDTQITNKPKEVNEFVNTWSPEGFYEEGVAPAELGWGTHEKKLPLGGCYHKEGPKNQIYLTSKGMNTKVRSWVPMSESATWNDEEGDILGMVIRHGEAHTISEHFTVYEHDDDNVAVSPNYCNLKGTARGKAVYRPTVHYAYLPSDCAVASLEELRIRHYQIQPRLRVMGDDIVSGNDFLGVLLMGHDYKAWWIGSLLDIHEARELVPHQNATTLQVAISMTAAVQWAIKNPQCGVLVPDDLPHKAILQECYPWLGPFISRPVNWSPLKGILKERELQYDRENVQIPTADDEWQFTTFLVSSS